MMVSPQVFLFSLFLFAFVDRGFSLASKTVDRKEVQIGLRKDLFKRELGTSGLQGTYGKHLLQAINKNAVRQISTSSNVTTSSSALNATQPTVADANITSSDPVTVGNTSTVATNNSTVPSPCTTSGATSEFFRMNIGGGAIESATMGAENEDYLDKENPSCVAMSDLAHIESLNGPAPWDAAYITYRWVEGNVLRYRIPVEEGTYTVKLLFTETVYAAANERFFQVLINGVKKEDALDVYDMVGMNVGLLKEYTSISVASAIEVAIIRVRGHPMLSGILIEGPGAGSKALGGGCGTPSAAEMASQNGFNHRAHAVGGDPVSVTDFGKVGSAMVSMDGTLSHSHFIETGPPEVLGQIISYQWSWTEVMNGSEVMRENKNPAGKFRERFPLGRTLVKLDVIDNTGDTASDLTEVDVKLSTTRGVYCYGHDLGNDSIPALPAGQNLIDLRQQKPSYGGKKDNILFNTDGDFGNSPIFQNSFMYECRFFLNSDDNGLQDATLKHNGPFILYQLENIIASSELSGETDISLNMEGIHEYTLVYFLDRDVEAKLELIKDGKAIKASSFSYDEASVLPVISHLSETESTTKGGGSVQVFGSGFLSNVKIFFGTTEGENVRVQNSGHLQVRVPQGRVGEVRLTVQANDAVSNGVTFVYTMEDGNLRQPVAFTMTDQKFELPFVASVVYGPDYRLYLGTHKKGLIHAVGIDAEYRLKTRCTHKIGNERSALGLAFSPFSNRLRLFFSSSTTFWKKEMEFEEGWVNGKIETVDFSWKIRDSRKAGGSGCSFNQTDLVTGLPVSAHDHSVNKLEFTPDGRLLMTIGGFTNGGISVPGRKREVGDVPDDAFGGVASNPLSAAVVSCPHKKVTHITYDNYTHPEQAKIVGGKECFVYASGVRNSFGMTLHTNGHLYVTDNGGSRGNGDFATDCNGGFIKSTNQKDKLFRVERGGYHGHPNLNRGECSHYPATAVQPLLGRVESSTPGILEYRSNIFGGELKGDLLLAKFATNKRSGRVSQVRLDAAGGVAEGGFVESLHAASGVAMAEGPNGELVMPQVQQKRLLFVVPRVARPRAAVVVGVVPRRGPRRGGARVLVAGFGFGLNSSVWFGDQPCLRVRFISKRRLTCTTPRAEANSQVAVAVEDAAGRSLTFGSDYWYF